MIHFFAVNPPTVTHAPPSPPIPWDVALLVGVALAAAMAVVVFAAWFVWRGAEGAYKHGEAESLKHAAQPPQAGAKAA